MIYQMKKRSMTTEAVFQVLNEEELRARGRKNRRRSGPLTNPCMLGRGKTMTKRYSRQVKNSRERWSLIKPLTLSPQSSWYSLQGVSPNFLTPNGTMSFRGRQSISTLFSLACSQIGRAHV